MHIKSKKRQWLSVVKISHPINFTLTFCNTTFIVRTAVALARSMYYFLPQPTSQIGWSDIDGIISFVFIFSIQNKFDHFHTNQVHSVECCCHCCWENWMMHPYLHVQSKQTCFLLHTNREPRSKVTQFTQNQIANNIYSNSTIIQFQLCIDGHFHETNMRLSLPSIFDTIKRWLKYFDDEKYHVMFVYRSVEMDGRMHGDDAIALQECFYK